ncbi:MAG: signal peptide peptidase SppA [Thermoanaerobaculia bacterium]|nr:signal peptide peptidase SppA [Thermoanaerobaculia bacterium]
MRRRSEGKTLVIVLLVSVALAVAAVVLLIATLSGGELVPPGEVVLELDLAQGFVDGRLEDPVALAFLPVEPSLREVVDAIRRAGRDDRVVALVARVGAAPVGLATLQELRQAVLDFREGGKPAYAHAETLGEFAPGNGAYYLASAFDEIDLQPSGDVGLTGVRYEVPFYRGALDKLGVVPQLDHRREYKNAMNSLTETGFTEAHAEALQAVADSHFGQIVRGVAAGRGLDEEAVRRIFDGGPYLGPEALELGLVDRLAYRDELTDRLRERFGDGVGNETLARYLRRGGGPSGGRSVALIYGVGSVVLGPGGYDPFSGSREMGSETVSRAFREALEDDDVEAILFRVDSPGGSYVASDTIWRQTVLAKEAGKPVVVSMGDLAGSGGYFVAMAADAIVAQPGTITGSIGVYGGKLVTRELWGKLGIAWGGISAGERAAFWSGVSEFSPAEWERLQAWLDRIYDDFTAKVATGRSLTPEAVSELARGRIWTGEEAVRLGLVDELGGYEAAIARVRAEIGAAEDERIRLQVFPRPRSAWEALRDRRSFLDPAAGQLLRRLAPVVELARRLGWLDGPGAGALEMPWRLKPAG